MNHIAAYEQREEALFRVFLMLAALVVLTVRAGQDARRPPPFGIVLSLGGAVTAEEPPHVGTAVVQLLSAVHAAAHRLLSTLRADYELMNQPDALAQSGRERAVAHQCGRSCKRLDSS